MKINPELTCFFPVLGSESGFKKKKTVKQDNERVKNY